MTESADTSDAVPDDVSMSSPREFRQPKWYGPLFSGGLLFFVGMAAFSVWAAATNADGSFPRPFAFAVVFGLAWSCWILVGVWGLADWWKHRLIVGEDLLHYVGVVRDVQLSREDLVEVQWRGIFRRGTVVIQSPRSRLRIHLDVYPVDERDDLIDRLRTLTRDASQKNWETFSQMPRPLSPEEQRREVIWNGSICCGPLLVTSLVFAAAGAWGLGWHWYALSIALAVAAVSYLVRMWKWIRSPDPQSAGA